MSAAPPLTSALAWDERGLLPVVAQDAITGEIRMLAWANAEAVSVTLASGRATFFSRSRAALWTKGETSGNVLAVRAVLVDCDADALVYLVDPVPEGGPTCHTGRPTCFFRVLESLAPGAPAHVRDTEVPAPTLLARLEAVLEARKASTAEASYVKSLYEGGPAKIGAKLREEAGELAEAIASEPDARVVSEAADLVFHVVVALRARGLGTDAVLRELDRRAGTSGHDEKRARTKP